MKTKLEIKQRLTVLKALKSEINSRYMPDRIELASINAEMTTLLWVLQEGSTEVEVFNVDGIKGMKEVDWIKDADRREIVKLCAILVIVGVAIGIILTQSS